MRKNKLTGPNNMGKGMKVKNFKQSIKKVIIYLRKERLLIIVALVIAVIGSIFTLLGPDTLTKITDAVTSGIRNNNIDIKYINKLGFILMTFYLFGFLLTTLKGLIITSVMQKMSYRLRSEIVTKIDNLKMSYFSKNSRGDILSRVTNDVDTMGQSLQQSTSTLITAGSIFLGSLIMMYLTNVILATTALLSTVIGFVMMTIIMKKSQGHFAIQQKILGKLNGHIEEMYSGHTIIKAYNAENNAMEIFDTHNKTLKDSAFKAQALSGLMMPIMQFIGNFGYVGVCIVGALLAINNQISFGIIVAFMVYIRLFTQPLGQIAQSMQQLQSAAAAAHRVFEFLEEEEMTNEDEKANLLQDIKGNVEFVNVKFGYEKDKPIIKNFSASIKAGQKVAIVGPTGAGKTTLVNLLMRFYDIDSGDILLDGLSINDVKREDVHSLFSMVLQDTWIFEGTLKENLIYATKNVSEHDLIEATKAVGLHHFIKTLQHGYDTVLNDNLQLSLGQKQQITIARSILANKPMIILDEATSSIDTRTELEIQNAMDILMSNRTSFVIAHRLSTIKNADLILVVKDGDVCEKGNHHDLLKLNGFYASLYNSQFEQI